MIIHKQIAPVPRSIAPQDFSELLTLDSSEKIAECFDRLLSSLYSKRDRLAQNALPGTVQSYEKHGKIYWKRHFYSPRHKKTISQSIAVGQVQSTRQSCEEWQQMQVVNQAIASLILWRDRYAQVMSID